MRPGWCSRPVRPLRSRPRPGPAGDSPRSAFPCRRCWRLTIDRRGARPALPDPELRGRRRQRRPPGRVRGRAAGSDACTPRSCRVGDRSCRTPTPPPTGATTPRARPSRPSSPSCPTWSRRESSTALWPRRPRPSSGWTPCWSPPRPGSCCTTTSSRPTCSAAPTADGSRLSSVIDWGDAWVGDPLADLARLSMSGPSVTTAFLDGYGLDGDRRGSATPWPVIASCGT